MTLKDVVLEVLNRISEDEIREILESVPAAANEDAAEKLEQRRKADRERQARHRANKSGKKAADPEPEEGKEDPDEEDYAAKYADKTAVELFKLCKARKMSTVAPKKPQAFYIELLVEQDKKEAAAKAKAEAEAAEEDAEDWGDEEEEKPAFKKGRKSSSKKTEPAPAEDEDEGEWDI